MKRRQLFKLLLLATPAAGLAQPARVPALGILAPRVPETPLVDAFVARLRELGHAEGRSLRIERRILDSPDTSRFSALAAELVRLRVDVIFAASMPAIQAAKSATGRIPIVFETLGDPVAAGLVASLSFPGGNLTGIAGIETELAARRLELLKEAVPRTSRVAVLRNPANAGTITIGSDLRPTARKLEVRLRVVDVREAAELETAFIAAVRRSADALLALTDPLFDAERDRIVALAEKVHLPAIYPFSGMAEIGGLMAYSPNHPAMHRDAAVFVDKILRGAKPADLPVARASKLDLAVNVRTATALGLTLPEALLLRADIVVQ